MDSRLRCPDLRDQYDVDEWLTTLDLDPEDLQGKGPAARLALAQEIVQNCIILEELLAVKETAAEIAHLGRPQALALAANPIVQDRLPGFGEPTKCPGPVPAQIMGSEGMTPRRQRRAACLYRAGVHERERQGWDDWYGDIVAATRRVLRKFNATEYAEMFVRMIAVTSPRRAVVDNVRVSAIALRDILRGDIAAPAIMKDRIEAVRKVASFGTDPRDKLAGVRGKKVEPFAKAMFGDGRAVAVDIWMMRAFSCQTARHKSPSTLEVGLISAKVHEMSEHREVAPRDFQADAWVGIKTLEGKRRKDGRLVHTAEPLAGIIEMVLPRVLAAERREQFVFRDLESQEPWDD